MDLDCLIGLVTDSPVELRKSRQNVEKGEGQMGVGKLNGIIWRGEETEIYGEQRDKYLIGENVVR